MENSSHAIDGDDKGREVSRVSVMCQAKAVFQYPKCKYGGILLKTNNVGGCHGVAACSYVERPPSRSSLTMR